MKDVKSFDVELSSNKHIGRTSNIGYDGSRQSLERKNRSYYNVKYMEGCPFIYMTNVNSTTFSEGDFGSYKNETKDGYLYIAKNEKDFQDAIDTIRKKKFLPKNTIGECFLGNFSPDTYNCDNNFPIRFAIIIEDNHIKECLKNSKIGLRIEYFDDFVFADGLSVGPHEELPRIIFLTMQEFKILINDREKRIKLLWKMCAIDFHYNQPDKFGNNILDDCDGDGNKFRDVIIKAFRSLYQPDSVDLNLNIKEHLKSVDSQFKTLKQNDIDFELAAIEDNKKYFERHKGETFLTPSQIRDITGGKSKGNDPVTKALNKIPLIKIAEDIYKKHYNKKPDFELDYLGWIRFIIDKISNPQWGPDSIFGHEALTAVFKGTDRRYSSGLDTANLDLNKAVQCICADLDIDWEEFTPILSSALRTALQTIQGLLEK